MKTKLTVVTALAGTLLATCLVSGPAKATSMPVLRGVATPGIVTLVGRGGRVGVGRGGVGVGRYGGVGVGRHYGGVGVRRYGTGVGVRRYGVGVGVSVLVSGVTMADATVLAHIITGTARLASTAEGTVCEPPVREPWVREPRVREPRVREPRVREPRVREPRVRAPRALALVLVQSGRRRTCVGFCTEKQHKDFLEKF